MILSVLLSLVIHILFKVTSNSTGENILSTQYTIYYLVVLMVYGFRRISLYECRVYYIFSLLLSVTKYLIIEYRSNEVPGCGCKNSHMCGGSLY